MNTRTIEHVSFARNVLRDAIRLLTRSERSEQAAGYRCLLTARTEIDHAIALVGAIAPDLAGDFATGAQQARIEAALGHKITKGQKADITVDEYAFRSDGGAADGAEDEILDSIACDRAVEAPSPAVGLSPRRRYMWDHQLRKLVASASSDPVAHSL